MDQKRNDLDLPAADLERGVYGISVAAELVGMGPQNLRAYEAQGLLEPERTPGGTRRYSNQDLSRLRRIGELLSHGLNLVGIATVIDLETENQRLRTENEERKRAPRSSTDPRHATAKAPSDSISTR